MGTIDKVIRMLTAAIIWALYYTHVISGTAAVILLVVAGVFTLTSFVGFCPLYRVFGLSTRKKSV